MCDEAKLARWARQQVSRRQFGVIGAAGAAGAAAACAPIPQGGGAMREDGVSFATADGTMDAVFIQPASANGAAIIHWPDIAGLRPSHLQMGRRLAGEGYSVLVVNPYYRDEAGQIWEDFAAFADGGWDKAREYRAKLSSHAIKRDTDAIVNWLDGQQGVSAQRGVGARGFCMGGPFTVYSAHARPDRVKAAASFHGGGLVRDDEESPHRLLAETQAHYLIAIAQDDDADDPDHKTILREAAQAAGRPAVVDVYAGDHGWTVPDSPAYARPAAERAWADELALYRRAL